MGENTAAIQTVVSFIKNEIDQNRWSDGVRLPTTGTLARRLQVNTVTLGAALKILASEQLITIVPRKGVFVGKAVLRPQLFLKPISTTRDCVWRRILRQLEHDLFCNVYSTGELPEKSILQERYGVCYQTICKICDALVRKGVLTRYKNRYRIVPQSHSRSNTSVLSISNSMTGTVSLYNPFIQNGMGALELLCSRHNLTLVKKTTNYASDGKALLEHLSNSTYFGYVVWVEKFEKTFQLQLFELLAKTKKPVAFIDEFTSFVIPSIYQKNDRFKIFVRTDLRAGRVVGQHLLERGHRKCAYISPYQHTSWSIARHEGVVQAFNDAGYSGGVVPALCQIDSYPLTSRHLYLQKIITGIVKRFPSTTWSYGPQIATPLMQEIGDVEHQYNVILAGNLFLKALSDPDITAWVCANDSIAIAALWFFKNRDAEQPHSPVARRAIAVVGFDDILIATESGLSTYNFMPSVLIENVIGYLIRPRQEFFLDQTTIECEGLLIERESSGARTSPLQPLKT